MGADLSRVRLNSLLDFAAVELKQGGVLLDADANESMAIVDRRLRALASDVLGRATVSSTTPDAFKLALSGGQLEIGKGRLYVDGLLAENHGATSDDPNDRLFDDLMAEMVFADAVPYSAQPYLPQPPNLPAAGRHLVYLDVWNREVTQLENPNLVEPAVGVETTSRVQTVWQVRVLGDDAGGSTDCASPDTDFAGWGTLIAPSTGVLSTGTYEVAAVDDPCELPATGGYRGLENQLYRVEIQDAGQPGAGATFKWSRENASVGSTIASVISSTELELPSLGRDDVLRFNTGDWVEITDDVREFSQAAGEIRRITVNEATRRVTFVPALPGPMLPASFPDPQFPIDRHLRIRRWDQKGRVFRRGSGGTPVQIQDLDTPGSTGVINVPAAGVEVLLENGVTVTFDSTGTTGFKAGDYWVFAARTSDASVEILNREPPRGIHHHYARLGIWDVTAGTVTDCRHPWPPSGDGDDCGCSTCVTPASHASGQLTIQDAVNKVAQTGGTVCLSPGIYALKQPVRVVNGKSVRIRGQGPTSVVVAPTGGFSIEGGTGIAMENFSLLALGNSFGIFTQNVLGLSLRQLVIALVGTRDQQSGAAVGFAGVIGAASIRENAILAPIAIAAVTQAAGGATIPTLSTQAPRPTFVLTASLAIDDNLMWCQRQALNLTGTVLHLLSTRFSGNEVVGTREPAVSVLGLGAPGSSMFIRANSLTVTGDGIRCGVDGAWIEGNKIANVGSGATATVGIALATGLDANGSDQCQILSNQISGFGDTGIRIAIPSRLLLVKLNIIENCGNGIMTTDDANGGSLSIESNQLRNIGPSTDDGAPVVGIGIRRAITANIVGNVIRTLGVQSQKTTLRAGIFAIGVTRTRVLANEVTDIGPPTDFLGTTAGIMIRAPFTQFDVSNNHVQRDADTSSQPSNSQWNALSISDIDLGLTVGRAGLFTTVNLADNRTLVLGGGKPFVTAMPLIADVAVIAAQPSTAAPSSAIGGISAIAANTPPLAIDVAAVVGANAAAGGATPGAAAAPDAPPAAAAPVVQLAGGSVLNNTLIARGAFGAVTISARGECLFNNNRVDSQLTTGSAVVIATTLGIVSSNRVRGGQISIQLANAKQAAVLGNITTGPIVTPGGLQQPWLALNLRG